jgi:hypothetical protein
MDSGKQSIPLDYERCEVGREVRIERTEHAVTAILPGYGPAARVLAIVANAVWLAFLASTLALMIRSILRWGLPTPNPFSTRVWLLAVGLVGLWTVYSIVRCLLSFARTGHAPRKFTASANGLLLENFHGLGKPKFIKRNRIRSVATDSVLFRRGLYYIRFGWRWLPSVDLAYGQPARMELIAAALNEGLALPAETPNHI